MSTAEDKIEESADDASEQSSEVEEPPEIDEEQPESADDASEQSPEVEEPPEIDVEQPRDEEESKPIEQNRSDIKSLMKSKKESDTYSLAEDVYAFIFVAPVSSYPFIFSSYVVLTKIICYAILVEDISWESNVRYSASSTAVKFFLVPVAVAMQEDLIQCFSGFANIFYDPQILETHKSATEVKYILSSLLRLIDGILSLVVNFYVMLSTTEVLSVFLNFAALQFLQSIDDIFYELVTLGFFGDEMEHWATQCEEVELRRRVGPNDKLIFKRLKMSHLDSLLFGFTLLVCLITYAITMAGVKSNFKHYSPPEESF